MILVLACLCALSAANKSAAPSFPASYRKDAYLPWDPYPEVDYPPPLTGGRVTIALTATVPGTPERVYLNGAFVDLSNSSYWAVDWLNVYPPVLGAAGQPFYVMFHSCEALWDEISSATISVQAGDGTVLAEGTFPVQAGDVYLTYVTPYLPNGTAGDGSLLAYVENNGTQPLTLEQIVSNAQVFFLHP